jgi:hypothetical protein
MTYLSYVTYEGRKSVRRCVRGLGGAESAQADAVARVASPLKSTNTTCEEVRRMGGGQARGDRAQQLGSPERVAPTSRPWA